MGDTAAKLKKLESKRMTRRILDDFIEGGAWESNGSAGSFSEKKAE